MSRRWRSSELGLWAPLLGQEAAQVGSARALGPDDFVFPSYREHGVAYCRGVNPVTMLRLWRGTGLSGWDPAIFGIATPAIIVGSQALHATGYALGITLDGAGSAALTYFGDGATSEGDVAEALGLAASYRVPVVFFCQNNQWAISEPAHLQSHATIAQRGQGYGIPGIQVDGNDVLAVLAATRLALARARAGGGPTLIEAVTYRMGPHTTSDDPSRYRTRAEEEEWRVKDPLARLRTLLYLEGLADEHFEETVDQLARAAAAELRRGCLAMEDPEPAVLFDHVYAEPHPLLDEERAAYAAYLDGFDEES
jgi:2-oxoisovalerate dehydrogenase E1 component alpha subunit